MKRLDLSCLPLNLEVGEKFELIDNDASTIYCSASKRNARIYVTGAFLTK